MGDAVESLWTYWYGHPEALIGVLILQGLYLLGVGPVRERYGLAEDVDARQVATFTAGVFLFLVAEVSPLHVLSDRYLFSAHMLQHVIITLLAPPLIVLGTPHWLVRFLLRPAWAFRLARVLTHPILAFAAFNLVFSMWHIPALYTVAVEHHWVHFGQHLLLVSTALLMWWPIASTLPELPKLSYPFQMAYLFLLSVAQIIVFGIITFSREPIYQWYAHTPRLWNISPLTDQQIGGIIMKVGSSVVFLTLFVIAFFRWFNQEEQKARIQEALEIERQREDR